MFSRIQDLDRFKNDCKRFTLGIQGSLGEVREEGQHLFNKLIESVQTFDNATMGLVVQAGSTGHRDHASAQEVLQKAKEAMEIWMHTNAPNIHIDEAPKVLTENFDK